MKRIVEDYEAKLRPPDDSGRGGGKAEWERYGNGEEELSVRFRKLDVPDGAMAEVRLAGRTLAVVQTSRGGGIVKLESSEGAQVPPVATADVVEVVHDGAVLLTGEFAPD